MPNSPSRLIATLTLVILVSGRLDGQIVEIGQGGGQTISGNSNSTVTAGESMPGGLNASDAFSEVQRADRVGVTDNTGRGFSASSVSPSTQSGAAGGVTPGGIGGGQSGFGGVGGFGGFGGFGQPFGGSVASQGTDAKPILRTRLRSAVQVQPLAPAQVGRAATGRFEALSSRPRLRGIQVTMQGRTAVLQGSVDRESDRRMSHLLMRLEPGVSRVDNQISLQPQ